MCIAVFGVAMAVAVKQRESGKVIAPILFAVSVVLGTMALSSGNNVFATMDDADTASPKRDPRLADPTILPTLYRTPITG